MYKDTIQVDSLMLSQDSINYIDTARLNDLPLIVKDGLEIASTIPQHELINGIDNSIIGSIFTLIVSLIVRYFEKRALLKKLK